MNKKVSACGAFALALTMGCASAPGSLLEGAAMQRTDKHHVAAANTGRITLVHQYKTLPHEIAPAYITTTLALSSDFLHKAKAAFAGLKDKTDTFALIMELQARGAVLHNESGPAVVLVAPNGDRIDDYYQNGQFIRREEYRMRSGLSGKSMPPQP